MTTFAFPFVHFENPFWCHKSLILYGEEFSLSRIHSAGIEYVMIYTQIPEESFFDQLFLFLKKDLYEMWYFLVSGYFIVCYPAESHTYLRKHILKYQKKVRFNSL